MSNGREPRCSTGRDRETSRQAGRKADLKMITVADT
jgi:hypothetical protein